MHRILPASLALLLLAAVPAWGQSCRGLASFAGSRIQVNGDASVTIRSSAIGGGVSLGFPRGPFGQLSLATRSHENFGGSSLDLGAATGYEIPLGGATQLHLCPLIAGALQLGPDNAFNSDVRRRRQSAQAGLGFGAELTSFRRWNIVPSIALSYAYQRDDATDQAGAVLFQISDYYTLAQLGIGFVYKSNLTLRPYLDLPLWLSGGLPSVGLTVGYRLGKKAGS